MLLDDAAQCITVIPMTTLTFKVRDEEAALIRRLTKASGLTVSEFIRRRTLPAEPNKPRELAKAKYTGAMVFKGHPDDIPLTNESVTEVLADFP